MNEEIKKMIETLLTHMGVSFTEIEIRSAEGPESLTFVIRTNESGILIGKQGEHFTSLKHVVKKMVQKKVGSEDFKFSVDVNDYQTRMLNDLKTKIKIMGDRALSFKVNIELEPMSSYERMIVHAYFSENPELSTESVGEGRNRHVVIRYTPDKLKA